MIRLRVERNPSSLTYLHRYIYFDTDSITDEQEDELYMNLQQEEGENGYIISYLLTKKHPEKQISSFFPCKSTFCMIWHLRNESENAAESKLFSSWKTKVNKVCRSILNTIPIGFVDISSQGIYMYQ